MLYDDGAVAASSAGPYPRGTYPPTSSFTGFLRCLGVMRHVSSGVQVRSAFIFLQSSRMTSIHLFFGLPRLLLP